MIRLVHSSSDVFVPLGRLCRPFYKCGKQHGNSDIKDQGGPAYLNTSPCSCEKLQKTIMRVWRSQCSNCSHLNQSPNATFIWWPTTLMSDTDWLTDRGHKFLELMSQLTSASSHRTGNHRHGCARVFPVPGLEEQAGSHPECQQRSDQLATEDAGGRPSHQEGVKRGEDSEHVSTLPLNSWKDLL